MVLINAPIFSLVTNRSRVKNEDFISVIEEVVAGGVNLVQIREKDLPMDQLKNLYFKLADRINNNCLISVCKSRYKDKIIVLSAIDNLIKGGSGQGVQNMNIIYNFPESRGLI